MLELARVTLPSLWQKTAPHSCQTLFTSTLARVGSNFGARQSSAQKQKYFHQEKSWIEVGSPPVGTEIGAGDWRAGGLSNTAC